jgi:hypothetical protein
MKEKTDVEKTTKKMMGYLDNFREVVGHGSIEEKKNFIRQFVKEIIVNPGEKSAKIMCYNHTTYDIIMGVKNCSDLIEVNYP